MPDKDRRVGSTADGLVVIRSGQQAERLGLHDLFAKWFVTDDGRKLARMALEVDAVYEEFNLARFLYTSSLLSRFADQYEQMVFLGAGFDCRALWLSRLNDGRVRIYEVDTRAKIEQKLQRLEQHGIAVPHWNRHIICDLRVDNIPALLKDEGLQCGRPVLVLAEGLFFYLASDVTTKILDPKQMELAKRSLMVFDCWSADRVNGLNARVSERIGVELFQEFPCVVEPEALKKDLIRRGYSQVRVTPLKTITQGYCHRTAEDEFSLSWYIVEAIL